MISWDRRNCKAVALGRGWLCYLFLFHTSLEHAQPPLRSENHGQLVLLFIMAGGIELSNCSTNALSKMVGSEPTTSMTRRSSPNIFNTRCWVMVKKNRKALPRSPSLRLNNELTSRLTTARRAWCVNHISTVQEMVDLHMPAVPLSRRMLLLWHCWA